nr:nucleotide-binding alpha-beta plait domain-containing protein [Tanacetum cinerariifolium]
MGSQRSKEDEVSKISTSVFVTNFPDQFNAKELWNTCKQYRFVVNAFIPTRRSKAGKRFGFVRFINVFDGEHLVNNLCTIWIGSSWFSQIQQATCDFTTDGRVSWVEIEGKSYWIRAKEVSGWVLDFVDDTDDEDESDDDDDEGEPNGIMLGDSDAEAVPDTMFEVLPNANGGDAPSVGNKEMHLEDPFNIYDLLKGIQNIPEDDVSSEVRKSDLKMHNKENGTDSTCSRHFKKSDIPYFGGSILLVMDELVKVGQTMGYNMEGCMKNIEEIIELEGVNVVHR